MLCLGCQNKTGFKCLQLRGKHKPWMRVLGLVDRITCYPTESRNPVPRKSTLQNRRRRYPRCSDTCWKTSGCPPSILLTSQPSRGFPNMSKVIATRSGPKKAATFVDLLRVPWVPLAWLQFQGLPFRGSESRFRSLAWRYPVMPPVLDEPRVR